ncbi:MAG: TrbG/VirB9 family P-type conjugative transfer protein [Caulobacteraceae bacterium]|nr:TrbG/VirB9 family P-type conjugative transfer protein [Caulobacteraceae bacterium]
MMRFILAGLAVALVLSPPTAMAQEAGADQCPALSAAALEAPRRGRREPTPTELLARANEAARQRPETTSFTQARQIYTYAPGAIYELYTSPSFISAILLEPGESLGDVAAGDTARWMVQETNAEAGVDGRTIVLVKPQTTGSSHQYRPRHRPAHLHDRSDRAGGLGVFRADRLVLSG